MRRGFQLPEEDEQYVQGLGLPWETIKEGDGRWLVVHSWPVPPGYNHSAVTAGLMVPASYPDGPIDMVYFHPHLSLICDKTIGALATHRFDGKEWQRWSRHRTGANPWRPGVDNIATHFLLVEQWLRRELPGVAA